MMIQNRHKMYSMCRHLKCPSCIAAIALLLGSDEFTLSMPNVFASICNCCQQGAQGQEKLVNPCKFMNAMQYQ